MNDKKTNHNFDEPLIWIYDPRDPAATDSQLAQDPLADFDRKMMVVDKKELDSLMNSGVNVEFV